MDPRERFADSEEALRVAMRGDRAGLWTALPGFIVSFNTDDPGNVTAVVQPAIKGVVQKSDGQFEAVNLPLLPDVPVVFPRGGGCTLTFPIRAGDECLVIFSSRCIDAWWQNGGTQLPMEPRMHDLSDGFAILGPQSKPHKIANISTTAVQLRSDDGQAYVQLDPSSLQIDTVTPGKITAQAGGDLVAHADGKVDVTAGGDISAQAGGNATVTASGITLNGPVTINGTLHVSQAVSGDAAATFSGDVQGAGKSLSTHQHSGVRSGGDTSGPPV